MATENEFDVDGEGEADESNGMKALRKQIKTLNAEKAAREAELAEFRKGARSSSLAQLLKEHNAPEKLAKYVTVEDPSSESVLAWLNENGDDFGWVAGESDDTDEDAELDVEDVDREQARRISRASAGAPSARSVKVTPEFIRNATRPELIRAGVIAG